MTFSRRILPFTLFLLSLVAPSAAATTEGPCTIHVAGADLSNHDPEDPEQAISVAAGADIPYGIGSDTPIESFGVIIQYGPIRIPYAGETGGTNSSSVQGIIPAAKFENLAVGIYRVDFEAVREDGEHCTAEALIRVQGPLLNAVTVFAAAVGIVGVWSIWATILQLISQYRDYVGAVQDYREGRKMA